MISDIFYIILTAHLIGSSSNKNKKKQIKKKKNTCQSIIAELLIWGQFYKSSYYSDGGIASVQEPICGQ